jgi:hypothetical protein
MQTEGMRRSIGVGTLVAAACLAIACGDDAKNADGAGGSSGSGGGSGSGGTGGHGGAGVGGSNGGTAGAGGVAGNAGAAGATAGGSGGSGGATGPTHTVDLDTSLVDCDTFDGGVQPGDVIELTSGTRGNLELRDCFGTEEAHITIRKSASATRLQIDATGQDGLLCQNCRYVDIDGLVNWTGHTGGCGVDATLSETPLTDCGILVKGDPQFLVKFRGEARFITVQGIEADGEWPHAVTEAGADVAISPNDQNYCVPPGSEWREGFSIRRNYMHDVAHEIFYFGPNVNYGNCSANQDVPRLRDIEISHNFLRHGGWDGVNLKSAYAGNNLVHHNVVLDIGGGTTASGANSVGIALFESEGSIYHNKVRRTATPPGGAPGLQCSANNAPAAWGTLHCEIYGNDVSDTDGPGITILKGTNAQAQRSANIYNNTVTDTGEHCITIAPSVTGGGFVRDNLTASCGAQTVNIGGTGFTNTNNANCTEAACGFVSHASNDYRITSASPAHDQANACPVDDLLGTARPKGAQCDQGAYELDE